MDSCRITQEPHSLLKADKDAPLLNSDGKNKRHKNIAKMLWISQHSMSDLQSTIRFHYARVESLKLIIGTN